MQNKDQKLLGNISNTFWDYTHNLLKIMNQHNHYWGHHFKIFCLSKLAPGKYYAHKIEKHNLYFRKAQSHRVLLLLIQLVKGSACFIEPYIYLCLNNFPVIWYLLKIVTRIKDRLSWRQFLFSSKMPIKIMVLLILLTYLL